LWGVYFFDLALDGFIINMLSEILFIKRSRLVAGTCFRCSVISVRLVPAQTLHPELGISASFNSLSLA
jgi:hypothetical protein